MIKSWLIVMLYVLKPSLHDHTHFIGINISDIDQSFSQSVVEIILFGVFDMFFLNFSVFVNREFYLLRLYHKV